MATAPVQVISKLKSESRIIRHAMVATVGLFALNYTAGTAFRLEKLPFWLLPTILFALWLLELYIHSRMRQVARELSTQSTADAIEPLVLMYTLQDVIDSRHVEPLLAICLEAARSNPELELDLARRLELKPLLTSPVNKIAEAGLRFARLSVRIQYLDIVRRLAQSSQHGNGSMLQEQAQCCLEVLTAELDRSKVSATLIRPVEQHSQDALLRSVVGPEHSPGLLLQGSTSSDNIQPETITQQVESKPRIEE